MKLDSRIDQGTVRAMIRGIESKLLEEEEGSHRRFLIERLRKLRLMLPPPQETIETEKGLFD